MESLLGHCAGLFYQHKFILITFLLAGTTGGFSHCITMCGPFVACQASCKSSSCSNKSTLIKDLGLQYHFGRATTYGILGFLSAYLAKQIAYLPLWHWVAALMLVIAGGMFLLSSLPGCKHSLLSNTGKLTYLSGALLGFLPCGLLYAALMMAATTANPILAMVAMWLFVLGTVPALLIAHLGTKILTKNWQKIMQRMSRAVMAFNGFSLFVMAIKLVR